MFSETLKAQWVVTGYFEIGETNVSEGIYLKLAPMVTYQIKNFQVNAAIQNDIISNNPNFFSGISIDLGQNFKLFDRPFRFKPFFMKTASTELLRESNWGLLFTTLQKHFNLEVGTNFRTIGFTNKAIADYHLVSNTVVRENFNLMYQVRYDLKSAEKPWNIGATWTNFDHFLIYQETTPMVNVHGFYNIKEQARLFAECWYKTSGALNLNVNYFGLSLRTGIIWKIK